MHFFQNSVFCKHLKAHNTSGITAAYFKFKAHFPDPLIQENIFNNQEKEYHGVFFINQFVGLMGYFKNPSPAFNFSSRIIKI
jgi:hypothetical protein